MQIRCKWAHESYKLTLNVAATQVDYEEEFSKLPDLPPIHCGLNDWAAIQAIIIPDRTAMLSLDGKAAFSPDCLPMLRASCSVYKTDNRFKFASLPETLPATVRAIGCVIDDDGLRKADMILSDGVVKLHANEPYALFFAVEIPRDAHPGIYTGELKIFGSNRFDDEILLATMTFELNVHTVALPKQDERIFYLDLWQHSSNIARKHETPRFSAEHYAVLENYAVSLADIGQRAITILASDVPWAGQSCAKFIDYPSDMYEYSMASVIKRYNGTWEYDFKNIEKTIALYHRCGIKKEVEIFGLIGCWDDAEHGFIRIVEGLDESIRVRYYDEKDGVYKYMRTEPEVRAYVYALYDYFVQTGLIDDVRVVADEPSDLGQFMRQLTWLKRLCPRFKYKCAINHVEFIEGLSEDIDDFVPYIGCLISEWEALSAMRDKIRGRLLWYVCCSPEHPNTFIKSPLLESRFIPLLTQILNLDGFLRWNYTVWPEKPRENVTYKWPAGDTHFVYPGNNGKPIPTLRYYALKRGIDEFEYAKMLEQKIGVNETRDMIARALSFGGVTALLSASEDGGYSIKHEAYDNLRREMILLLSQS